MDYYALLGVARTSEDVVIRAAYLALMRRYHPDANSSPEASERVREVTKAYGVLGDPAKRREYNRAWDPYEASEIAGSRRRPPPVGPMAFGITMLCVSVFIGIIWAQQPPGKHPLNVAEEAIGREASNRTPAEGSCSSIAATKEVRRDLMRQAAQIRGTEQRAFAELTEKLVVRTTPIPSLIDPSPGLVACSVAINIQLPEGVSHRDGKRALLGNGDYFVNVYREGDGPLVEFIPDPRLLTDLASLTKAVRPRVDDNITEDRVAVDPVNETRSSATIPRFTTVRSSASASNVRGLKMARAPKRPLQKPTEPICRGSDRWTALICGDANLSALEQQLTVFERQSSIHADARKRNRLQQSGTKFENDRTACRTEACARRALVGRTTEVAEIIRNEASPAR